jgi:hypothetical protein
MRYWKLDISACYLISNRLSLLSKQSFYFLVLAMGDSKWGTHAYRQNFVILPPYVAQQDDQKNRFSGIAVVTSTHSGITQFMCTTGCDQLWEIQKNQKAKTLLIFE